MEILADIVVGLLIMFVLKDLILRNKAKKTLEIISALAIKSCEENGIPPEYSEVVIKSDRVGLLAYCKDASKALLTGPNLSDRGISSEQLEVECLKELAGELVQSIEQEYQQLHGTKAS
jgi:hypothetical protein